MKRTYAALMSAFAIATFRHGDCRGADRFVPAEVEKPRQ